MQYEGLALKPNVLAFRSQSKAEANQEDVLLPAHPQKTVPVGD